MTSRSLGVAALGACLAAAPFRASDARSEWDLSAGPVTMQYESTERGARGYALDEENGTLRGIEARLGWREGRIGCALQWLQTSATIDYSGATQIGLPIASTTALNFRDDSLGCGYRWRPTDLDSLDAGLEFGRRSIHRTINPTIFSTALGEELTSDYGGIRIDVAHRLTNHFLLYAQGGLQRGIYDRLDVNFYGYADAATLRFGARLASLGAIGLKYSPISWVSVSIDVSRHRQSYGASRPQPLYRSGVDIGFVDYPGSVQYQTDYGVSANLHF